MLLFDRYAIDSSGVDEFTTHLSALLDKMRAAPGCLWADGTRAMDDEPSFVVASEWRTEADAEAWLAFGPAAKFETDVDAHLRGDVTRRRFVSP